MAVLLGSTGTGVGTPADFENAGVLIGSKYVASATGTIDKISIRTSATGGTSGNQATSLLAAIYADSAGSPGAKIGNTVTISGITTATTAWWTSAAGAGAAVTSGTTYWIVILSPSGGGQFVFQVFDASTVGGTKDSTTTGQSTLPGTFGTISGSFTELMDAYAEEATGSTRNPLPLVIRMSTPPMPTRANAALTRPEPQPHADITQVPVRRFNGINSVIDFPFTLMGGAQSYALLAKVRSQPTLTGLLTQTTSTNGVMGGILGDEGAPLDFSYINNNNSVSAPTADLHDDNWEVIVVTKTAGTTAPRFHRWDGFSWVHEQPAGTIADPTLGTSGKLKVGSFENTANRYADMDVAVAAAWNVALSDAEVEGLVADRSSQDWADTQPGALQLLADFNQTTVSTVNDLSGNGRNQTAEANTAVVLNGPAFWAFGATPAAGAANLSGTAAGVGSVTANLTAAAQMSGTADGVGSVTATLTSIAPANLSGTAAGVGAVTANLTAASQMSGTAAGVGAVTATLTAPPKMTATAAGVGSVTATLSATTLLSGTAAGVGAVTATLTASSRMTGTAAGVGSVTANLTATSQLSGTAAGVGSVTATLTASGNANLSGTAAGVGSVTATLSAAALMSATAAGVGSVTATLSASPRMSGSAAGIGAVTANLTASSLMSATAAGVGSVAAQLTASSKMSGTAAGVGAVAATLTVPGPSLLTGTAVGVGSVAATLTAASKLTATATGIGSVTAALTASPKLTATAAGVGTATGTLKTTAQLTATAAGIGSVTATLKTLAQLSGIAAGVGTATGAIVFGAAPDALETLTATLLPSTTTAVISADGSEAIIVAHSAAAAIALNHMTFAAAMASPAPLNWHRFEETTGTSLASAVGGAAATLQAPAALNGKGGIGRTASRAVVFDGTANSLVIMPFAPGIAGDWTFLAWVYNTGAGTVGAIDHNAIMGNGGAKRLLFQRALGYILAQFGANLQTPNGSVALNRWHLIGYSWDGTTGASAQKVWIDGQLKATGTGVGVSVMSGAYWVGSYLNPGTNYMWKGNIDEPAIYNVELTAQQHMNIWLAGKDEIDSYGVNSAEVVDTIPSVTIATPHEIATVAGPHNMAEIAHG